MLDRWSGAAAGEQTFPWVALRKVVQILALGGILFSFAQLSRAGRTGGAFDIGVEKLPLLLDPLAVLAQGVAGRQLYAGSLVAVASLVLTLLVGRVWCGWLCPLGTVLDWVPGRKGRVSESVPDTWRRFKIVVLGVILTGAIFSNLTLLIFDPLTITYRTLATAVWPGLERGITAVERLLFQVPAFQGPVSTFDSFVRKFILPSEPLVFRAGWLYAGLFLGVLALNSAASRFWCRYVCPLGGLLGIFSRAAIVKCSVNSACTSCGICEEICPTGAIQAVGDGGRCDPSECTMCMRCYDVCSREAVQFTAGAGFSGSQPYDPGRRELLISLGAAAAGVGLTRLTGGKQRFHPDLLSPPGTNSGEFLSHCVRCGGCVAACPTGGLQPSLLEYGWEGLWTPVLVPRLGYCDYSCRACGQACPVQAIPLLSLEEKRQQEIGKAYLNRELCIAWAENRDCIVCEEMCPIAEKAITLKPANPVDSRDNPGELQQPYIHRDQCIGCGICEYQCPVEGEAAIRVFSSESHPDQRYY